MNKEPAAEPKLGPAQAAQCLSVCLKHCQMSQADHPQTDDNNRSDKQMTACPARVSLLLE